LKVIWYILPFLYDFNFKDSLKALTTDEPTPCKPPDDLYEPDENLPPACKTVKITSAVGRPLECMPVGIPRPLSLIVILSSRWMTILISSPKPLIISSTALSVISYTK